MTAIRSLHVVTSDARRGAETFALDLVRCLQARGDDAAIVALRASDSGCPHPVPALGRHRRMPNVLTRLRRAARGADVVVAHGSSTLEACAAGLVGSGRPFVYRSIGDPRFWITTQSRRRAVSIMLRRASRVVALWPEAVPVLVEQHGLRPDRVDVIPNGIVEERFRRASTEERSSARAACGVGMAATCLAFVGALSPEKEVGTAIDALHDQPDAVLLVAGDGPDAQTLRRRAEQVAPGRVRFLGQVVDSRVVYAAADLLLLPSRSEGMPAVIIEAGLVGTPTIATAVGAVPSMISDGVTGFLVPPADATAFVRRTTEAVTAAPPAGDAAAATFRGRYSIERVAELWSETLRAAVAL